ncbi:MAG: ABC transporter ATP-binding protein [Candidatus Omnitrophica bacterium]|nr:ABC transporter ATP-binding protein [Candidatus Omnitrophota bacterium]
MIEAKNLTMYYGSFRALNKVSFVVKEKEIVGLLGPNGAGKTTLMRILTTFISPTQGTAKICGFDVTKEPVLARRMIGYLPETPPLYMDMRVDDFIDFVGKARGLSGKELKKRKEWVIDAIQIGGVWKDTIAELSLGYKQRVGLAQALIHDPKVVILDEPTSGLDPMQIVGIRKLIKELAKEKTIIFSTHILQEASSVSDRLLIIDQGRIIAEGTIEELKKERSFQQQTFLLALQAPRLEVESFLKGTSIVKEFCLIDETEGILRFSGVCLSYRELAHMVNHLVKEKGWFLKELTLKEPSLEEIFLGLFKKTG